jgi:uncharacterized PurR-regulated membrane protein YhhQ (DUF165 family)
MNKTLATLAAVAFLACIIAANYVTTEHGMVPVGFGLMATAGTYFAGLTFVLRDSIQDYLRAALTRTELRVETVRVPAYSAWERWAAPQLQGLMRTVDRLVPVRVEPSRWIVALPILGLIVLGAGLSYLLAVTIFAADPAFLPPGVTPASIAIASGVAFLTAETFDLLIYTPLRERGYIRAAVASNVVGAFVDTVLFLWIAGFPIAGAIAGQMVGKVAVTALVVGLVAAFRVRRAVTA